MINRAVNSLSFALQSPFVGALTMTGLVVYHKDWLTQTISQVKEACWKQVEKITKETNPSNTFLQTYAVCSDPSSIASNQQNPLIGMIHDLFMARLFQCDFLSVRNFFVLSSYIPNPTAFVTVFTNKLISVILPSDSKTSSPPALAKKILKCAAEKITEIGTWWGLIKIINHYKNLSPRLLNPMLSSLKEAPPCILQGSYFMRCIDIVTSCI